MAGSAGRKARGPAGFLGLPLVALALPFTLGAAPAWAGDIAPTTGAKGLGSLVNDPNFTCHSGACISGGTEAGRNLFHRFDRFDTTGINNVLIKTLGYENDINNVIMGVINGKSVISTLVGLESKANLFWLSPGGISITGAGGFKNVGQLSLSTANKLRIGAGVFNVFDTSNLEAAQLTGTPGAFVSDLPGGNGDITLDLADGSVLEVDSSLLLDAQGGNVLLPGDNRIAFTSPSGGSAAVTGKAIIDSGKLVIDRPSSATPGTSYTFTFEDSLKLSGANAAIGGSTDLVMSGSFEWSKGAAILGSDTISGSGRLITNADTTLAGTEPLRIGKSWFNSSNGNISFTEAASVQFTGLARLDNFGVITLDRGAIDSAPVVSGNVLLFNVGTIKKSSASSQRLDLLELQNIGTMDLGTGSLFINSPITLQSGSINLVNNAKLLLRPNLFFNQGTITGSGSIELGASGGGTLNNRGTITPGQEGTAGRITISGSFIQEGDGRLLLDIGGPNPGASDQLVVTGKADLPGGTLASSLIGGYVPTQGDSIEVLRADAGLAIGPGLVQILPPNVAPFTNDNSYSLVVLAPPIPPDRPTQPEPPVKPPVKPPEPPVKLPEPPIVVVPPPEPTPITPPTVTPPVEVAPPDEIPTDATLFESKRKKPIPPPVPIQKPIWDLQRTLPLFSDYWRPQLAATLQEELDAGSFSSSGETPGSGAASGRRAGAPTILSLQQARESFLQGESQAQCETVTKLGLAGGCSGPAPTPERLQCLLREATDWVRSGQAPVQGRPEEDPCRS